MHCVCIHCFACWKTNYLAFTEREEQRSYIRRRRNVFLTSSTDFKTIYEAIQIYERASGARLNPQKSHALATGKWNTPATEFGIEFQSRIKTLGFTFGSTIKESTTAKVDPRHRSNRSASAKRVRQRVMPRSENTICAIMSLRKDLVRGTDPPTEQNTHTTTDNNMHVVYMARNDLRVPTTTLHRQKTQGGWAMLDVAVKCRRLRLFHMWMLNSRESSVTASWLEHWSLKEPIANPQTGTQSRTN